MGSNVLTKGIGVASKVISLDSIVLKQLDQVYASYKKYVDICERSNKYFISCFGTELFYGAVLDHHKNLIDANLSFGTRCVSLNKSFELISQVGIKELFIDIPNYETETPHSLYYLYDQIQEFAINLEELAGPIDEEKVIKYTELINNIKNLYLEFYSFFKEKYLPMRPTSFQHLFSMINLSYIDLICAPKYLYRNLKSLIQELKSRIVEGKGFDSPDSVNLLLLPSFGGYDGELCNYAAENNAFVFYSD
ncbi:MAG: 2-hydroxyacyl-CoA dehydratase [Candidatus Helarchaeota archaeon]